MKFEQCGSKRWNLSFLLSPSWRWRLLAMQKLWPNICWVNKEKSSDQFWWLTSSIFNFSGAQGELSLTHEFIESQFIAHRDLINPILEDIQKFSIDLYLDSIDAIKLVAADTREQMSQFGLSPCANASRAQWERRTIAVRLFLE